jgi:hypothetical protein
VLTGHSLGSSIAVLLCVKLRSIYSEAYCIAFGASGSAVCKSLAEETKKFVLTVVYGNDFVPRLSFYSGTELKNAILQVLFIFVRVEILN